MAARRAGLTLTLTLTRTLTLTLTLTLKLTAEQLLLPAAPTSGAVNANGAGDAFVAGLVALTQTLTLTLTLTLALTLALTPTLPLTLTRSPRCCGPSRSRCTTRCAWPWAAHASASTRRSSLGGWPSC